MTSVTSPRRPATVFCCLLLILSACSSSQNTSNSTPLTGPLSKVVVFAKQSQQHVTTPVRYAQTPPIGGEHAPIWQNCGFYSSPIAPEEGVHSMEHGAVWITYSPTLPAADKAKLKALAHTGRYILVSPFDGLPSPVVASAWARQLKLTGVDDPGLIAFIAAFEVGPQTPEPGAACTGGDGTPE
jgi:hypothetical protein